MFLDNIEKFREDWEKNSKESIPVISNRSDLGTYEVKRRKLKIQMQEVDEGELLDMFDSYISYCHQAPIMEARIVAGKVYDLPKMNVPHLEGFFMFGRFIRSTWHSYCIRYPEVCSFILDSLHSFAYAGAAAGVLKSDIVSKKLGLSDSLKVETTEVKSRVVIYTQGNGRSVQIEDADEVKELPSPKASPEDDFTDCK
jgi:hypothetical protein